MANDTLYRRGMAAYQSAIDQAGLKYREAERIGDDDARLEAWQDMASLRVQMREAHEIAMQDMRSTQGVKQNPHGLTDLEVEVAKASIVDNSRHANLPKMTEREKIDLYAEKKAKLHAMRASGEYRQTTDATG